MNNPPLIQLDLRKPELPLTMADWLRETADEAFAAVRDLVTAELEPDDVALIADIDKVRTGIRSAETPDRLAEPTRRCLEVAQGVAVRTTQQKADQRRDMAALSALVREALTTVGAEVDTLHSSIAASTARFDSIAALEDPRQMRALLVAQVTMLKRVAAERRRVWDETVRIFTDRVVALEQQLRAVREVAATDPLTGIGNRARFDEACQELIKKGTARFVLAVLDVDDFKQINDKHGHAAGDQVLVAVARGLRGFVRESDTVARIGGDEFAILASDITLRQAERRFVEGLSGLVLKDEEHPLACVPTLSCGVAEYSAGDTPASLFERADRGLYTAKRQRKTRVVATERPYVRDLIRR